MRKFFFGLGVVAALVVVAGGIGFFILARNGAALDTASKAYTQDAVVAIAAHWDAAELWKRASPRLRQTASFDKMRDLMSAAQRALGALREYRDSKGQSLMAMTNAHSSVSAQYVAAARFDRGDALFRVVLVKDGEAWQIEGFHVDWHLMSKGTVGNS